MGFVDSVKGLASKVGGSVERGAKTVSANSKKLVEKTKVKSEISSLESNINADYIILGKAMFEKICDNPESEFENTVSDIKEKNKKLSELKAVLMSLEEKMFCTNCGAQISKDQSFCDKCGQKVQIEEDVAERAEVAEVVEEAVNDASETAETIVEAIVDSADIKDKE